MDLEMLVHIPTENILKYYIVNYFAVIHQADLNFMAKLIIGGFALRTSTTVIMRIGWSQVVSSTTLGVSTIPTAGGFVYSSYDRCDALSDGFALRRLTATSVRTTCNRVVTSTTAVGVPRFPTAY